MLTDAIRVMRRRGRTIAIAVLAAASCLAGSGPSVAYVGPSFIDIPGVKGTWAGETYKNWVELKAQYWTKRPFLIFPLPAEGMVFSGPYVPSKDAHSMSIAVDKGNPALPEMMAKCRDKTAIPELTYAESSDLARYVGEHGPRPANVPEFYEYKLKDASFVACTVVPDAPQQGFLIEFKDIEWLNFKSQEKFVPVQLPPAELPPNTKSGATKSFIVTWQAPANYVSDDQCPKVNTLPPEDSYWTYVPKAQAEKERAQLAKEKKVISYFEGGMETRGPNRLNVCRLPGIVPDTGHASPRSKVAHGFDLDGNDGTGAAAAGTCKHPNYASADDGRTGIDNQFFTVIGCVPGYQGHKGFFNQYMNEDRRNGSLSTLIEVRGIDNEQNDDDVDVVILYSDDKIVKSADGKQMLPDYTFRPSEKPRHVPFFAQLHGRIENGVIVTETVDQFRMNVIDEPPLVVSKARMRLQILPDGSLKGFFGGYQDWRRIANSISTSMYEQLQGFTCPGLYNALRRGADGMKDPVTGECTGISTTWDIEGVPAFLPNQAKKAVVAGADAAPKR